MSNYEQELKAIRKICQKHGTTLSHINKLLRIIEAGILNSTVMAELGYSMTPKLERLLDDMVEAKIISRHELEPYSLER